MYEPLRATAGGTTRTPALANCSSPQSENLVSTLSKNCRSRPPFMMRLSFRRKDNNTAFLTHWLTIHSPSFFSATRKVPASSWASTSLTAARTSSVASLGLRLARFSNASSIICCNDIIFSYNPKKGRSLSLILFCLANINTSFWQVFMTRQL